MRTTTKAAIYLLAALMFCTGIVYLSVAYGEGSEMGEDNESKLDQTSSQANTEANEENEKNEANEANEHEYKLGKTSERQSESEERGVGPIFETVFFSSVGIAYFPIGIWMILKKETKKPYIIAMIGSAGLIAFYAVTRLIDLPIIGLQDDVGTVDIVSKILQGLIVVVSAFALTAIIREKRQKTLV
jgi:archaellum component FlaF (FlaF/FlaG flagellin family)